MRAEIGTDISKAARLLTEGEVVAIPTETVYGLAGNALNEKAVLEIFHVKNRPSFDPLIVHVGDKNAVMDFTSDLPPGAMDLMDKFWPGPLTILLPKKQVVPDLVTSGLQTVGVRMPDHPLTLSLLRSLPFPLAAPSANPFGYISPTTAAHVADQLGEKIPYILDGGICRVGVESTIVGFENGNWRIYRYGGVPRESIEEIVGMVALSEPGGKSPAAPGMLESHYAPRKKMMLGNIQQMKSALHPGLRTGYLFYRYPEIAMPPGSVFEVLSAYGNADEAACHLFAAMRRLDAADIDIIIAEPVPEEGLGRAINDRLRRASA